MNRSSLPPLDLKHSFFTDANVPQLFAEAALSFPEKTAIQSEEGAVTYYMLLRHALDIASRLLAAGAVRGSLVGLAMPRSPQAVAAILGALFAGCAYVPLDVEGSPETLLRQQIIDSGIAHVLVDGAASCKAAAWSMCASIPVLSPLLDMPEPGPQPVLTLSPEDPAYVMFTSGSTGKPKGVIVPHRAIVRLVSGQHFINFSPNEIFLLHSPLSFDASTLELWGSLLHGACLAIAPPHPIAVSHYRNLIERFEVTTLWMTSAVFHLVAEYAPETFRGLRQLIIGGDIIQPLPVRRIQSLHPGLTIVNGYGPTENCTFTTCYRIPNDVSDSSPLPIGRPIEHTSAYVLDSEMRPVPDGVAGELVAGGSGVALGYLNLPRETAERFVPDPFSSTPNARMYRTGDRVCRDPSGLFHFLGRLDQEVKISGRRIDLAELERLVQSIDGVRACAAFALDPGSGQKELFLAVEMPAAGASAEQSIRKELSARLPAALLPARILVAERFAVNQNGKIDRAAIREMLQHGSAPSHPIHEHAAPQTTLGAVLEIWRGLLANHAVGVDDNFFDSGGTSLLLIRLHAELDQKFPGRISIVDLFQATTVRKLSALIETRTVGSAIPLESGPVQRVSTL